MRAINENVLERGCFRCRSYGADIFSSTITTNMSRLRRWSVDLECLGFGL
jgi:hypothetical protein